jgi:hypothetical protein
MKYTGSAPFVNLCPTCRSMIAPSRPGLRERYKEVEIRSRTCGWDAANIGYDQ